MEDLVSISDVSQTKWRQRRYELQYLRLGIRLLNLVLELLEASRVLHIVIRALSNEARHALDVRVLIIEIGGDVLVVRVVFRVRVRVRVLVKVLLADVVTNQVDRAEGRERQSGWRGQLQASRRHGLDDSLLAGDGELDHLDILDETDVDRDLLSL